MIMLSDNLRQTKPATALPHRRVNMPHSYEHAKLGESSEEKSIDPNRRVSVDSRLYDHDTISSKLKQITRIDSVKNIDQ